MDPEGSTPADQSGQQDYSSNDNAADNTSNSNAGKPQFYESDDGQNNEEEGDNGTPSPQEGEGDNDDQGDGGDQLDPELETWAKSQNIELDSPSAIKLAQRLRETQKALHQKSNESKQQFNEATANDPANARLEAKLARMDFFEAHPDARELEGAMYDLAVKAKEAGNMAGFAYYQTPEGWTDLYQLAKANATSEDQGEQFEAGKQAERKNLAKKQQASSARRNATDSTPSSGRPTDDQIGQMSQTEYSQFRKENPEWDPYTGWRS